jgi:sugar/nucleoside kinase (ribokinase family)
MKSGIAVAGNIIVDRVKLIDAYPAQNNLCNIKSVGRSVGGLVCNVGMDLAALDKDLRVFALGCVGDDADGAYAAERMREAGIDVSGVKIKADAPTSFTDVMTVESTGARTFFHARGANALFGPEDINFERIDCGIFHLGYALLLDKFDAFDEKFGTVMAKTLFNARKRGFKTSIDAVSATEGEFRSVIAPSLKHCNYAVFNETESDMASGISPRDGSGKIIPESVEKICRDLFSKGVSEYVIIHCPEAGFLMDADYKFTAVPSLRLPPGFIKGAVGAGDAFCAGALYSVYKGFSAQRLLEVAAACAACNLSAADSVGGARSFGETIKLIERYKYDN